MALAEGSVSTDRWGSRFRGGEDWEFSFRPETLEVQVDSVKDIGSQAPSAP